MNLAGSLRDLGFERARRYGPDHVPACPPTWEPPAELLAGVTILWPRRYDWPEAEKWLQHIRHGLQRLAPLERADLAQGDGPGVARVRFVSRGRPADVAFDYADDLDHVAPKALERSVRYFKMQYRRAGYADGRIVPAGYPAPNIYLYNYIEYFRRLRATAAPRCDVYGRFGLQDSGSYELRRRAVALLRAQRDFHYEGGLVRVRHSRSLREAACAPICIDLPGNGDFCFRLIDYLALGACVLGPRPRTEFPCPLVDREHVVHCAADLSDLVPLCRYYLDHAAERARIGRNAQDYFDRVLHRDQLARYYLHEFGRALGGTAAAAAAARPQRPEGETPTHAARP